MYPDPGASLRWKDIRQLAFSLGLPAITERDGPGDPCLLAHGHMWTWWDQCADAPGFRLPSKEREFLIAAAPDVFFNLGGRGVFNQIYARPERVDPQWIRANLMLSWRALAPSLFQDLFPGQGPRVPSYSTP